jgi:flagellar hook-associated protein 2
LTRRSEAFICAALAAVLAAGQASGQDGDPGGRKYGGETALLMADLTVPGVTSKFNTQKIIDALMETERIPLKRLQQEEVLEKQRKSAWQDLNRELTVLRDAARKLYGFQNPFSEKVAFSSDSKILTATATREAADQARQVAVKKTASADRFLSQSLSRDFTVDAGEYVFAVGDKEVRFTFKGGSLKEFAEAVNRRGGDLLAASVVQDTKTTQVILLESKRPGAKNRLVFTGPSADFALKAGLVARSASTSRPVPLSEKGVETWAKPLSPQMYGMRDGALTLEPGSELRLPVRPSLALNPNFVLELSVKTEQLPQPTTEAAVPPPGPAIPETGSIEFKGIRIQSLKSEAPLPPWKAPQPQETVTDPQVLFMEGGGKLVPLPPVPDSGEYQKLTIPVGELGSAFDSLDLRNRSTYRRVSVKDIVLYDKTQRGDYAPRKPLSEASDSIITVDGVDIQRDSNVVEDAIPGVKLSLKAPGADPVELKVGRDAEGIKKELLGFIGTYDRLITTVDILSRRDPRIIDDAVYLSDEEKKKAADRLGLLFGDLTLQQVKDSLQRIMMNPYPTSRGKELSLLAQAGISTDVRKLGTSASVDKTRLRGYLEVDEARLDETLNSWPEAMKELFGNDTNADLVVDSGVAYSMDTLLRPYVQTGGILPAKVTNTDGEISRTRRKITDYQRHLDDYQAQLKRKYAQMEGAMNAMEKSAAEIDNFNKRSQ